MIKSFLLFVAMALAFCFSFFLPNQVSAKTKANVPITQTIKPEARCAIIPARIVLGRFQNRITQYSPPIVGNSKINRVFNYRTPKKYGLRISHKNFYPPENLQNR